MAVTWRQVGIPTGTSIAFALKTTGTTSVRIKIGTNAAVTSGVVFSPAVTPDAQGYSKPKVTGLTPNTKYWWQVEENGGLSETINTCRTAPTTQASFSFALASCTSGGNTSDSFTDIAGRAEVHFFLHTGDFFYEEDVNGYALNSTPDQADYRSGWDEKLSETKHQQVFANMPTAYTWSDHDAGIRNSGTGGSMSWIGNAGVPAYRQIFPVGDVPYAATTGIYRTWTYGRVRFILADTRTFKSANSATDNASKTVLGTAQKAWFKDVLTDSDSAYHFVVFDAPWIGRGKSNDDEWFAYSTERAELGSFMAASGKRGMILSGDMHALAIDDGTNSVGGWPVFHAAPLKNSASLKGGPYTIGPYPGGSAIVQQYGVVTVSDNGTTLEVKTSGYSAGVTTPRMSKTFTVSTTDGGGAPPPPPVVGVPSSGVVFNFTADMTAQTANGATATALTPVNLPTAVVRSDLGYPTGGVLSMSSGLTTAAAAIAAGAYVETTIDFASDWQPGALSVKAARGNVNTPRGFAVRTSADNFATTLLDQVLSTVRPTWTNYSLSLAALPKQTGPLTVRIYPYSPGTINVIELDELTITGTPDTSGGGTGGASPSIRFNPCTGPADVPVTTDNSDDNGGDPFPLILGGGTTDLAHDTAGESIRFRPNGSFVRAVGWDDLSFAAGQEFVAWVEIKRSSLPSSNVFAIRVQSGTTQLFRYGIDTAGIPKLTDPAGGGIWSGETPIPLDSWFLVGVRCKVSSDPAVGAVELRQWTNPADVASAPTFTSGVINRAIAESVTDVRFGNTAANNSGTTYIRNARVTAGWTATSTPAFVDAGASTTHTVGSTVSLSAVGNPSGGTYSWAVLSGEPVTLTNAGTANPFYTAPSVAGSTTFRVTYTPPGASAVTDDVVKFYELPDAPTVQLTRSTQVTFDTRATTGVVTVTQTDGEPVTITESPTGVFAVDMTGSSGDVQISFVATNQGVSSEPRVETITAAGGGGDAPRADNRFVFTGTTYGLGSLTTETG